MAQAGMVQHVAVEIWVVGCEEVGFVEGMEVIHVSRDFQLVGDSVFHNCAERIRGCPLRKRIL